MLWVRNIAILFSLMASCFNSAFATHSDIFCLEKFYQLGVPAEKIALKALRLALLPTAERAEALKKMSRTELIVLANTALR
ncbi:MAG: hypothetical protein ACKOA8_03340, partial [Deltaproteobacteria bacterium]